jgi:hypothetical protein
MFPREAPSVRTVRATLLLAAPTCGRVPRPRHFPSHRLARHALGLCGFDPRIACLARRGHPSYCPYPVHALPLLSPFPVLYLASADAASS